MSMNNTLWRNYVGRFGPYFCAAFLMSAPIFSHAAMPWEAPMCAVANSLKGQVAVMLAVVSTIMIGVMFMYSETGSAVSKIAGWLLGMCCALSVASVITALFPSVSLPGCLS
jgi:type IV secretion system protein TrbC